MKNTQILNISLILSIVISILGALFKIMHVPFAQTFLIAGVLAMVVFWFVAMYEIKSSTKIDASEKFMWFIGLIFFGSIVGLVYLLSGRKRIV